MIDLLDHLGVERAHFAGLSLGGMTAHVARHPRARSASTGSSCCAPRRSWARRRCGATARRPCASRARRRSSTRTLERWLTEDYRASHDISRLREMFVGIDDEGYANCCAIIEHMDLTADLPQITAPTLVIGGAQDPSTPPRARRADRRARSPARAWRSSTPART